jgi:hypothetical protein
MAELRGPPLVHDGRDVLARAETMLLQAEPEDPSPGWFTELWLCDHPPMAERLALAATFIPRVEHASGQ